ncbi:MAG: tetratricopeptide repeat protein [Pyrinomonadaceae bacterium]|nr:tetratricopeptide repeat protein [Pyrinomonadaceae bacterium]
MDSVRQRARNVTASARFLSACALMCILAVAGLAQDESIKRARSLYAEGTALISKQTRESYEEALEKYEESRSLFAQAGEKTGEAKSLVGLGFVSDGLGRNSEALAFYEKAFGIFDQLKNRLWAARTLNNMARIYDDRGDTQKALELFEKALPLRRKAGDLNGEAVTLNGIGAVYVKNGRFEEALQYYNLAYAVRNSPSMPDDRANRRGIAIILNNIGRLFDQLGDKKKAAVYLGRSLPLRRATGDRSGEATTLNNLGLVEADRGNLKKALEYYEESLKIIRDLGLEFREAEVLNNSAVIHINQVEPKLALPKLAKSLAYYRSVGDRGGEATSLNNIALAELQTDKKATPVNLVSALLISRQAGEAALEAMTLNNLMYFWKKTGKPSIAAFYGKQSVNKYQEIRFGIRTLNEDSRRIYLESITDTYRQLADVLIELGQFAQANQVLNMLKAQEYFDFVRRNSDEIKRLESTVTLNPKEREMLERYKAIAERVTALSKRYGELDLERRKARRQGGDLDEKNLEEHESLEKQLRDANAAFRLFVEKQLAEELGKERVKEVEYDRDLQAKLRRWGEGTVAVYTVLSRDRYRVILTTPFVQVDGKYEIKAGELNRKIFKFRESLQDLGADPRIPGKELYDILLKPIEKDLKAAGAKTIVWSLDGTLRYIPIAALSPDGKSYLVEKYRHAVITSKTRDDLDEPNKKWKALGLGVSKAAEITNPSDPSEVIEFSAIPGSVNELNAIIRDERKPREKGLLFGRRFVDEDFTLGAFEDSLALETASGKPEYSVIHLASHFRLGNNWSDSFLLLGNGKVLTLEDLSNSPGLSFGDVELVTLSACDTAYANSSNGKEIDSLAGAIQTKSGKAVLATLWAVVDESTPLLMTEFYKLQVDNSSMTKAAAMREVQTGFITGKLKPDAEYIERLAKAFETRGSSNPSNAFKFDKNKPFAHPYFWSPFVLIGNWR